MPDTADGYAANLPDNLKAYVNAENLAADPMTKAVREHFKETGKNQGDFDNLFETLGVLEAKGFIPKPIDFAAETAKLSEGGKDGKARQQEVETYANALKARGDLDDEEFGELMTLAPTAAGVRLIEKLRTMTQQNDPTKAPAGDAQGTQEAAQAKAREMARDPRYHTDRGFQKEADRLWKEAYGE